jgi:hypothetical protein
LLPREGDRYAGVAMPQLWYRASAERGQLLPPLCPACLALGVRPLDVPGFFPGSESGVTAYYCERCADRLEQRATFVWARLASQAVLGIGAATSSALVLGGARVPLQVLLTIMASALPLGVAAFGGATPTVPALVHVSREGETGQWLAQRRDFLERLGATPISEHAPAPRRALRRALLPVLVSVVWLLGLHWLGRAELRVIQSGDVDAVVLIDHRRRRVVPPTRLEHAHAAYAVTTLAGRRTLGVIGEEGRPILEVTRTLWPGRDYVLGTLPAGYCLFIERQEYGEAGTAREVAPVPGDGPLWELPVNVDLWFTELPERPSLPTSGGIRTAIRLLPCR